MDAVFSPHGCANSARRETMPVRFSKDSLAPLAHQGECVVVCYNRAEVWQSRSLAAEFYAEAMLSCEGCERDRYFCVYLDLIAGQAICWDGVTEYITQSTEYR